MSQAPQQDIIALLSRHIGLNSESIGLSIIQRTIERERKKLGYATDAEYLKHLNRSTQTLTSLIESIVVPETNFFRHPESFEYLHQVVSTLKKTGAFYKHPLRILSLPCSTGEEAYSLAITLLEAGIKHHQFQIEGADINPKSLAFARKGIYSPYAFRNVTGFSPTQYLNQYFNQINQDSYQIHASVKAQVNFCQKNLVAPLYIGQPQPYDIIFCRNLLIYLHDTARKQAFYNLNHLLTPKGLLFVGFAETNQINKQQFTFIDYPKAFAFQKRETPTQAYPENSIMGYYTPLSPSKSAVIPEILAQTSPQPNHNRTHHQLKTLHEVDHQNRLSLTTLERTRSLANQGQLSEALEACDTYLQDHPIDPEAYLLLGEIYQAQGSDERAEMAFQKVLYLDPNCTEALVHLILLCEQQSNMSVAKRLRQRLQRITNGNNTQI